MKCHLMILVAIAVTPIFVGHRVSGQEVLLTIEPSTKQPRNSEGDIIELNDGRLCLIYTRFTGGTSDHAAADLAMRISKDGGSSWSDDKIVVRHEGGNNVMSVSLLRLADGRIALFYLRKQSLEDCRPIMRISNDQCATFSEAKMCINDEVGYYVMNNDRAVQLKSGRLVLPVALHNKPGQEKPDWAGRVMCYLSDDLGKSWRRSKSTLIANSPKNERVTVQEPGIVQMKDGRLMMFCRTNAGSQYIAWSRDQGDTWSKLSPSNLASPLSPATIERIPSSGHLLCAWNDHSGVHPFPVGKRSPHCIAISRDEGKTWSRSQVIEPDPEGWYCYTSMTFVKDRVLLAYCAGDKQVGGLNRLKVISLSKHLLDKLAAAEPARPAETALLDPCLDYGRSFINTKANWNSPRFWVESRCRVIDKKANKSVEYLQCGLCKAERTFKYRQLFAKDNYDFLPVFSEEEGIIFRRHVRVGAPYRDIRPIDKWWGGTQRKLRFVRGRVLRTPEEIFAAMQAGKQIVGQTELRDDATGRVAVIEYPVKTINFERDRKDWQVDTGPVILPDLSAPPERWSEKFQLAHIAFRTPYWADFIIDQPTPVQTDQENKKPNGGAGPKTYHYSGHVHKATRNVLLALDDE
ncbi:MAG: exo-alpha-sialidase [Planctomycetes bacterium]|nr:exo-alpha-sialidase [Planctomycetota bacterium]